MSRLFSFFFLTLSLNFNATVDAAPVGIHLRAKESGNKFKWSKLVGGSILSEKVEVLEAQPVLTNSDFKIAKIKKLKSPPNDPNNFEIELLYSDFGKKRFISIANKDRNRGYYFLFENEVFQCQAFPPEMKGLWDKSFSLHGPFNELKARDLVKKLNQAMK